MLFANETVTFRGTKLYTGVSERDLHILLNSISGSDETRIKGAIRIINFLSCSER